MKARICNGVCRPESPAADILNMKQAMGKAMTATLSFSGKVQCVPAGTTVEAAALQAGLNPDAYLFVIDGRPVPMDRPLTDGETVKALKVASGG